MKEKELKILNEYFNYRIKNIDIGDEIIDNIFYKEIYFTRGFENDPKQYLFKDFKDIQRFFNNIDKDSIDRISNDGRKSSSGIYDRYDDFIKTRIYEEIEKRDFKFEEWKCRNFPLNK